ncbi:MAG: DUF2891 family protein [Bacteroidales bacterium]
MREIIITLKTQPSLTERPNYWGRSSHSLPNIVDDSYEGGHWLGTFAIYALRGN